MLVNEKCFNISIVFNSQKDVLVLLRDDETKPFYGLYNAPGGKMEDYDSSHIYSAYRELKEETNISQSDITLELLGTFKLDFNKYLDVYYGVLTNPNITLISEGPKLSWIKFSDILNNPEQFAPYLDEYLKLILDKI